MTAELERLREYLKVAEAVDPFRQAASPQFARRRKP